MFVSSITLKSFRCFEDKKLSFDAPITLLEGENGSGKTSFLEALHYACYLRSFRTHAPKEIVKFGAQAFSINLKGFSGNNAEEPIDLQVGFSETKRKVKANGKAMSSYKQLTDMYRVITIVEDDMMLIKGAPELRRMFMDQAVFLTNSEHAELLRNYRKVLKQRNALLASPRCDQTSYTIWTEQLEQLTQAIQAARKLFLQQIETHANKLLTEFFSNSSRIKLSYRMRKPEDRMFEKERLLKRSLFGAHLDDCHIALSERNSKKFASRGQQKLIVMLLKTAQLKLLNRSAIVLIDDFMTDFDQKHIRAFLALLTTCQSQLILTCPTTDNCLNKELALYQCNRIAL